MVVTQKENGMVEVQSRSGEVIELDQGTYDLAKGLMDLYKRTSPEILKLIARSYATDPEPDLKTILLRDSIKLFLARETFLRLRHDSLA